MEEKPFRRKINKEAVAQFKVPVSWMKKLIDGEDFVSQTGETVPNQKLTLLPHAPKHYAYCSDTMYAEDIVPHIKGVDLLYHEATFTQTHAKRAKETFHSTGKQAAKIAAMAEVKQLVLGHYSARYPSPDEILAEARTVFENTIAGEDGLKIRL